MKYNTYKLLLYLHLLILTVLLGSCSAGTCFDETEARSKATFYSMETKKALSPDTLTIFATGRDTIYKKAIKQKNAEFPLFAEDTVCQFIVIINGVSDTMKYRYSSSTHLLSKECGFTFFFRLDTVTFTKNTLDSVSVLKKTVTTLNEENIRIFF
jgi:hypothetical protein